MKFIISNKNVQISRAVQEVKFFGLTQEKLITIENYFWNKIEMNLQKAE